MSDHALATELPGGTYVLDPAATTVSFVTRHMFGLGAVTGTFTASSATVSNDGSRTAVDATISAASFGTGDPRRDGKVISATFLDAEQYPDIDVHAAGFVRAEDGWTVEGTITVRGVSAPVTLAVSDVRADGDVVTATATATVDRYELGVTAMKGLAARTLRFTVSARFTRV